MDGKKFLLLSELFEQFRVQALMLLKDAEECGFLDDLTFCYNRKAYDLRKEQLLDKVGTGVVFVDVVGLKKVNDEYGHSAGDLLLRDLGKMLKAYFGGNDVFRVGGDEFIIFKANIKPQTFEHSVNEFRVAIETVHTTKVSIGYSYTTSDNKLDSAIKEAEEMMYLDKKQFYKKHPQYKR